MLALSVTDKMHFWSHDANDGAAVVVVIVHVVDDSLGGVQGANVDSRLRKMYQGRQEEEG
jgi:hypothetical protein